MHADPEIPFAPTRAAFLGMAPARIHRTAAWLGICAACTPALFRCCPQGGIFTAAFALQ